LIWTIVNNPELESVCLCSEIEVEEYAGLIASDERNVSAGDWFRMQLSIFGLLSSGNRVG
jgi:hypothetical protein